MRQDVQKISEQLDRLFRTYPSFQTDDPAAMMRVYFDAVDTYALVDIETAVRNFLSGAASGHNPAYAPSAPLLGTEVRRVMNLRLDSERRASKPALPKPDVVLSPEARDRMAALAIRTAEALRTPDRIQEIEAEERRKAGWVNTNARFQPDMSDAAVKKRLRLGDIGVTYSEDGANLADRA